MPMGQTSNLRTGFVAWAVVATRGLSDRAAAAAAMEFEGGVEDGRDVQRLSAGSTILEYPVAS